MSTLLDRLSKDQATQLRIYARRKQTPLSIRQLYEFGYAQDEQTLLTAAQFLHNELPKRLAAMAQDLMEMPCGLADTPSARRIQQLYIRSFAEMLEFPHPQNTSDEQRFTELLAAIKERHRQVVETLALALRELQQVMGSKEVPPEVHEALDRFYITRIGIRLLIGQHVSLHESRPGWVGIIHGDCAPAQIAWEAAQNARHLCELNYGRSPEIRIVGKTDLTFTYIPSHLHHMFFELLKNSLRAVAETHAERDKLPAITIAIARGIEDVTVKIEDEGGGLPRSGMHRVWSYLYTTAKPPSEHALREIDPMAGYGFGLPVTRLYARYFSGDLQLISMDGYGTDAYLHLNRLGTGEETLATR
jgi:pyruvate dehydrogenase kinase 2/3/4